MASVFAEPDVIASDAAASPGRTIRLRTWHVALAVVFAVGAFSLLFRLDDAKSLGSHEGYAIIPAREMLASGDYIVPRFGELPRLKKPPLIYWTIIASSQLAGGLDIWSARLPAAAAGLLLGGLMSVWAWRWYGGVAAVGAAAAQLTSVYVLVFARKAEADMLLVVLIAAALFLVVGHSAGESRRTTFLRWAGIWTCAAVSWLGKFHFGPAMIFVPAVVWLVFERRWRFLFGFFNPVGLLLFGLAVGVWPTLVLQRLPGAWAVWQEETIGRAVGELGRQPVWFYLPHLVTWTLPWTIFAVLAWPASWREAFGQPLAGWLRLPRSASGAAHGTGLIRRLDGTWRRLVEHGDPRERFLWIWLATTLAIVTVSANKHPHYILPALPAFSLWTARRFRELSDQAQQGRRLLSMPLAIVLTVLGLGAACGFAFLAGRPSEDGLAGMLLPVVVIASLGVTIAGWLLYFRRNRMAAGVLAVAWVVAYGMATTGFVPAQDHRIGAYRFAEAVRARYGAGVEIGLYGIDQDAAAWYLGEPVFRAEKPEQIAVRLEATPRLRLVTIEGHEPALARLGQLRIVERFVDRPRSPKVELGHYRQMVLVELTRSQPPDRAASVPDRRRPD